MSTNAQTSPRRTADTDVRIVALAALAQRDVTQAFAEALAAKADGLSHPLVHHLVALKVKSEGRFDDAIVELGLGLQLEPHDARLMTEVGLCLIELGRRREAARVLGVAIKLAPDSADTNFAYGWAAHHVGALDVAASALERAIALNPNHADALAHLSSLAVRRREWELGRTYAERAVAINPTQFDALMNLASIDLGLGDFAAAEARLAVVIAMPSLKPQARAGALLLLGDALDGLQRFDAAFEAYRQGKADFAEQFAHVFAAPGASAASDGARRILAEFIEAPAGSFATPKLAGPTGGEQQHVFLVGFPRSGTTLLEQVLAAHPEIVSMEERPALIAAEEEFLTRPGGVLRLAGVVDELLAPFQEDYWKRVREFGVDPNGKVFVDKHPLSSMRLPLIAKVFPSAKVIFAIRDPRDVVFSCFRRSFNMNAAMYEFNSLEGAARLYDAVMTAGQTYLERLPLEHLQLRYEDLVADFDGVAKKVCAFLDVPWNTAMRDFAKAAEARRIATPSSAQVARGLYGEGVGQWRNYDFALEPVLPILQPWIETFGYAPQ